MIFISFGRRPKRPQQPKKTHQARAMELKEIRDFHQSKVSQYMQELTRINSQLTVMKKIAQKNQRSPEARKLPELEDRKAMHKIVILQQKINLISAELSLVSYLRGIEAADPRGKETVRILTERMNIHGKELEKINRMLRLRIDAPMLKEIKKIGRRIAVIHKLLRFANAMQRRAFFKELEDLEARGNEFLDRLRQRGKEE